MTKVKGSNLMSNNKIRRKKNQFYKKKVKGKKTCVGLGYLD